MIDGGLRQEKAREERWKDERGKTPREKPETMGASVADPRVLDETPEGRGTTDAMVGG